jgi:septum formation protein
MRLVLASASPRRAELLAAAGFAFDVRPVEVDETPLPGEDARAYVLRLAVLKAQSCKRSTEDEVVLAADTTVVVDGELLAKPADEVDARRMLRLLSDRDHEVLTGVAVADGNGVVSAVEATRVRFAPMNESEIEWYVRSGEPADKAGAYAVQGLASRFVDRVEGSYSNVVGLPVARVYGMLKELVSSSPRPGSSPSPSSSPGQDADSDSIRTRSGPRTGAGARTRIGTGTGTGTD